MTIRKNTTRKYVPITIEAQQPNGKWWVRSLLRHENHAAQAGTITRLQLIEAATRLMTKWNTNYVIPSTLRVGGVRPKKPRTFSIEETF